MVVWHIMDVIGTVLIILGALWGLATIIWLVVLLIKSKRPTPEEYAQMEKERRERLARLPDPPVTEDNNIYYIPPIIPPSSS